MNLIHSFGIFHHKSIQQLINHRREVNQRRNLKREGDKGGVILHFMLLLLTRNRESSKEQFSPSQPTKLCWNSNHMVRLIYNNVMLLVCIQLDFFYFRVALYFETVCVTFAKYTSCLSYHFCVRVNLKLNTCISSQNTDMPAQVGKLLLLTQQTQKVMYSACTMCTFLRWNSCCQIVFRLAENWGWWCVPWGLASRPSWRQTVFGCSQPRWHHYVTTRQSSGLKHLIKIL